MAGRTWPTKLSIAVDLETKRVGRRHSPQDADQGDTTTINETAIAAAEQKEDAQAEIQSPPAAGRASSPTRAITAIRLRSSQRGL